MKNYLEVLKNIKDNNLGDFAGNKSLGLVEKAEKTLNIKFPSSYKHFLLELGCGDINGFEIYGIIDDNFTSSCVPNGIWLTLDEREKNSLLSKYVIIGADYDGSYFVIDTEESNENSENPIYLLNINFEPIKKITDDFGKFLIKKTENKN